MSNGILSEHNIFTEADPTYKDGKLRFKTHSLIYEVPMTIRPAQKPFTAFFYS